MQTAVYSDSWGPALPTGKGQERFDASLALRKISARAVVLAILVMLGTISLRAEPLLTLAMVDYNSVASRPSPAPKADRSLSLRVEGQSVSPLTLLAEKVTLPTTLFLQRQAAREPGNPFLLSLKNAGDDGRPKVWGSLTAGYGQIFLFKTYQIYGRNGAVWQEPGFGFLKFSLSF